MSENQPQFMLARLTAEHVAELAELDESTNLHPWTGKQWLDSLAQHECFGLWLTQTSAVELSDIQSEIPNPMQGHMIAGFVVCMATLDEAEILLIAIAPQHQRAGLGAQLLRYAENTLQREGVRQLFLEVRASNQPARAFYRHQGWQETGLRKNYYRSTETTEREDAIICGKNLSNVEITA